MSPTIRVRCPGCDATLKAPFHLLGQTRSCPQCRRSLPIRIKAPGDAGPRLLVPDDLTPAGSLSGQA